MNVKLKALTAGVLFFTGQAVMAQEAKKDSTQKETKITEVVIVAYGQQKKEAITGSVGSVKADVIKNVVAPNVVQGMVGKVAGVQVMSNNGLPGTTPTVRFRGIGSINGSSAPLYVVDGVPFNGDVSAINNADIESMSFLKDASAAALYGSRGANGVIVITTKKGRRGQTRYNFDTKVGVAMRGIQEYDIITSPQEYYEAYHRLLKNGYIDGGSTDAVAHTNASTDLISGASGLAYNITNVADTDIIGADGRFNPNASILYQDKWSDYLFREGFYTSSYFSGSGGSENGNYFFSLGYDSNDTYMVNSKFEKMTARIKADTKLGDRLKFGGNIAYTNMRQNAPDGYDGATIISGPFSWVRSIAPIYPVFAYDATGNKMYRSNGDVAYDDGQGEYNGLIRPYGSMMNPYATALLDVKRNTTNQIYASGYATWTILKGLDFTYNITGEYNNYSVLSMDTPLYGDAKNRNGNLYKTKDDTFAVTNQQLLTYNKKFGDLGLQVLAGHETLNRQRDVLYGSFQNTILPSALYGDQYAILTSGRDYGRPYSTEGYFGRVNLDYKDRYYLNANIRRDGSSRFHKDNRWGTFFGLGGAWVVSKESFLVDSSWINLLRLKASYGEQGNDNLGYDFPYMDMYRVVQTTDSSNNTVSVNQSFKGNKDVTWEKNANFNVGFDLEMFNKRFTLEAEYFNRKSYDMLYMRPLPLSQGFSSMPENIGDMVNRGVEVSTAIDIVRNDNFRMSFNANGTYLKNEILKLSDDEIVSGSYLLKPGNTRYTWRLREFVGVNPANGAALFTVVDATTGARTTTEDYTAASLVDTGKSAVPKFYGGFGLDFKYKNFDFTASFAYQLGGWGYDSVWMNMMGGDRGNNFHADYASTWTSASTSASLPVLLPENTKNYYSASTMGLIKSDYLSLQNVSLGYTLNRDIVEGTGLNGVRFYASADNVYLWSKRKGYDPRQTVDGTVSNNFSPIRTISVGVNVSF